MLRIGIAVAMVSSGSGESLAKTALRIRREVETRRRMLGEAEENWAMLWMGVRVREMVEVMTES